MKPAIASNPTSLRRIVRVQHGRPISIPKLKRQLLAGQNVETGFSLLSAPISPRNQTSFVAVEDRNRLLLGICLLECKWTVSPCAAVSRERYRGNVEVLFDLRGDGHGFCHYLFSPDGTLSTNDFSPYPEARSSRWTLPKIRKWKFESQTSADIRGYLVHWLWVWFDLKEIFRKGDAVGFNICREDSSHGEWSAWNFAAGFGFPDAQSLGFLCCGKNSPVLSKYPSVPRAKKFSITMLNDVPDTLIPQSYTPASINEEMRTLRSWGLDRAEWIDYSNSPAFQEYSLWKESYRKTFAQCPDLMREAAQAAHRHRLDFIADVKLLDLAGLDFHCPPKVPGALSYWDGGTIAGTPEMVGQEDAFMQSNPVWRKEAEFPVRCLRFHSQTEIPAIKTSEITILVSRDNKRYTPLDPRSYSVKVTRQRRRHRRWEPDGCHAEDGYFQNWVLEISGLHCYFPFLEIKCSKADLKFTNPAFLFVEAEGASGGAAPVEVTQRVNKAGPTRFSFHPSWQGWNNHNEWVVNPATWNLSSLGLAFIDPPSLSGMLEPTHPKSRQIWLNRIQELLDRGVDGISLRILCHHNNATSWLKYAFGPTVLEAFVRDHGRQPKAVEEDFARIRKIRGEAITELLRQIRKRCKTKKKILFQIETGADLPDDIGNRMQIHFDYEKWMQESLVDEFHVRAITGHCPWLRDYLLPLAKKHGVQVHLVSRNLENGLEMQAVTAYDRVIKDAMEMGYDGFTFYETVGLYELNAEAAVVAKGSAQPTIEAATRRAAESS